MPRSRETLFNSFFFALLAVALYQGARLFAPYFGPLLLAVILAILFQPMDLWLARRVRRPNLRALLSVFFIFVFFILPLGLVAWAAIVEWDTVLTVDNQGVEKAGQWIPAVPGHVLDWLRRVSPWLANQLSDQMSSAQAYLDDVMSRSFAALAHLGARFAGNTFKIGADLFLIFLALFFLFRDGQGLYDYTKHLLPMAPEAKIRLEKKMHETIIGVVRGNFMIAVIQGVLASLGLVIVWAHHLPVLSFLCLIAGLMPVVGTALIWGPVSVHYLLIGSYVRGIFLLVWGILLVGHTDTFLRPMLVSAKAKIPFFWLFFGLLGGVAVFGVAGIVLGPLIVAIIPILLDIYEQSYISPRS